MKQRNFALALLLGLIWILSGCTSDGVEGSWDYTLQWSSDRRVHGTMDIEKRNGEYTGRLFSYRMDVMELTNIAIQGNEMTSDVAYDDEVFKLRGEFMGNSFSGTIAGPDRTFNLMATKFEDKFSRKDLPDVAHILPESDLPSYELDLDHANMIGAFNREGYRRGERIYNENCINCHGTPEVEGSIPLSLKFWEQPFKAGSDPYSMYQTVTRGFGSMPAQLTLTPQEKYDVILYIREKFVRDKNPDAYFRVSDNYLSALPEGSTTGPEAKPYHPWSDMDYGNFLINTYELADEKTGPERYHSPGPPPFSDEDYRKNNFAYKGIAVRLDEGPGGVSKGNTWMIFDHDVMRVAGGWTGEGFIDWEGILLNDKHETYPRTVGQLHFTTPVGPGWANPVNGSFDDPRFKARDGRRFGPLPERWASFKGIYQHGNDVVIAYSVGNAEVLEHLGMEKMNEQIVFTRTLNTTPSGSKLKMRVAPDSVEVALAGEGASLGKSNGFVVLTIPAATRANVKLFIAKPGTDGLDAYARSAAPPELLSKYMKGGPSRFPTPLSTQVVHGREDGPIAVDQLTPPFDNPWKSRMRLSGIDFMKDPDKAVVCTVDGDIWMITGLMNDATGLKWRRIGTGLFQPLGIKVVNERIYVTCRDQLVLLHDLNGDGETDYYESFNHDHQVTDHFHEFAMGLQTDAQGNFYYAKSGRHAREALVPQHGTLIKVSRDGSRSEIIATGFRAANGVCINPDGSFIVTDQQGYWNPMNRINWVTGKGKFYGNMWGYNPPADTTRAAMEPPMVWVDMEFDRSPSELIWVDSEKWGPLDRGLLSLSYGYGKIQLVLHEKVGGLMQGGVIDLPNVKFLTGVMRGRFSKGDGQLYVCGMSAWGTSQMMKPGGLYRLRYTGRSLPIPIQLHAGETGIKLTFAQPLDQEKARQISNFEVKTWDLVRSSEYGSDRYNVQTLEITEARLSGDGKSVTLVLPAIEPVDVMTVRYTIADAEGNPVQGILQNTIHKLGHLPADGLEARAIP